VDGTTVAATTETGEPGPSYHTVWYRWTAPATGKFWFTATAATNYYATAKVWSGSSLTALAQLALSQQGLPKVLFSANAGDVFQIQVDESASYYTYDGQAPFTLTWGQATPPANDKFANAQPTTGMSGSVTCNTWAAGVEPGEPDHNYAPP